MPCNSGLDRSAPTGTRTGVLVASKSLLAFVMAWPVPPHCTLDPSYPLLWPERHGLPVRTGVVDALPR